MRAGEIVADGTDKPSRRGDAGDVGARPGKALGLAFERSLHPMLVVDSERRYVDANAAAELFMRMPREEILKRRVDEFVPPEIRDGFSRIWDQFTAIGSSPAESVWYFPTDKTRIQIAVGTTEIEAGLSLLVVMPWATSTEAEDVFAASVGDNGAGNSHLTEREREVLTLLALGCNGEQVAEKLFISPETVRTHVQHVRSKLGASTRGHAIALALTRGEISTDTPARPDL